MVECPTTDPKVVGNVVWTLGNSIGRNTEPWGTAGSVAWSTGSMHADGLLKWRGGPKTLEAECAKGHPQNSIIYNISDWGNI